MRETLPRKSSSPQSPPTPPSDFDNPYAAPATLETTAIGSLPIGYEVRGKKLAVLKGTTLPPYCIKTGEKIVPGENGTAKRLRLRHLNPWWMLLIFAPFGIIIYIILAVILTERGSVTAYVSKKAVRRKRLWLGSLLALGVGLLYYSFEFMPRLDGLLVAFLVIGGFLIAIALLSTRYVRTVGHLTGWFLISGVHKSCLQRLSEEAAHATD